MPIEFIDRFLEQDLAVDDLVLEARTGEGFIIRSIEAESAVADTSIRVIIQDTTMINIPCENTAIGLVPIVNRGTAIMLLYSILREKYPDVPLLRITEGEKFVITSGGVAGTARIHYVQLTGDLIPSPVEPGGSLALEKLFISHSKKNLTITLSGTDIETLDVSVNPAGMFTFPFDAEAPANYTFELIGMLLGVMNKHVDITIDGVRIWHMDKAILARDESFVPIESFPYLIPTENKRIFLFSDKIIIRAGDELKTEIQASNVNIADQTVDMYCTYIFLQKKVS